MNINKFIININGTPDNYPCVMLLYCYPILDDNIGLKIVQI